MNRISVREIAPDEIIRVRELFESVFRETFSDHVPIFEEVTLGEHLYVATLDGSVVGIASVWEPDCYIHFLFVDSQIRNHRIGSTLISRLYEIYGSLTLKCLVANKVGMAFYRATGWQELETGSSEDGEYVLLRYDPRNAELW